jgi:hypothetical protein
MTGSRVNAAAVVLAFGLVAPAFALDIGLAGVRPVPYNAIRDASGVLGYAESLLGPEIATRYHAPVGPGASLVEPSAVRGAWELPTGTKPDDIVRALRGKGTVARVFEARQGKLVIVDYRAPGARPMRLLLIDGTHPAFETLTVPEVRPGAHVYLIAYITR